MNTFISSLEECKLDQSIHRRNESVKWHANTNAKRIKKGIACIEIEGREGGIDLN
ncbi:hypothetical protein [Peribacillus sp. SI8-4]|uniref:hypothetical protein n=1 Tax=Peribacillus sp. SI8-4 TaxID=3048009 RepID=UPI00255231C0|nr:hypothetical protein [Peribacillus sp. SI8-4]